MTFREALENKDFIITAEICPPKGTEIDNFLRKGRLLKRYIDAINITDNQSAVMRLSSLGASALLVQESIEPIFQITCRDRNRLALQSDLLGAWVLGIRNVLALTGDHVIFGNHKEAKPVFDVDSVHLLQIISSLNKGYDMMGTKLKGGTDFVAGAVVAPEAEPIELQLMKFEKKIKAGAVFFQTQAVFDLKKVEKFYRYASLYPVKIMAGVLLIKSVKMARFLNERIPGVKVPESLIRDLENSSDPMRYAIGWASEQVRSLRDFAHGVHIMAIGDEERVIEILEKAGI